MPENVKDLIRAAQAAEIRGDKGQAIEYLRRAASIYETIGNTPRAQQMLRHAQRLSGSNSAGVSNGRAKSTAETAGLERRFAERGPLLAEENLDAWCSFCCRPRSDTGALVAGPTGAFICARCTGEAEKLLEAGRPNSAGSTSRFGVLRSVNIEDADEPRRLAEADPVGTLSSVEWVGGEDALALFSLSQQQKSGVVLVIGPSGSGKSAFLRSLESRGHGRSVDLTEGELDSSPTGPLLIDFHQPAPQTWTNPPRFWNQLSQLQVVISARGDVPKAALSIATTDGKVPLYSTLELARSVAGWLPMWLLERVTFVIPLPQQSANDLRVIGEALARQLQVKVSPEVLAQISALAAKSNRGAHELVSLLRRIPSGEVKVGQPTRRSIRKKKER